MKRKRNSSLSYSSLSRDYSQERFRLNADGMYYAHQPVYGINTYEERSEPDQLWRAAKTYQVLRTLLKYDFASVLDIGAGEGYLANLVEKTTGANAYITDISTEPLLRASQLFSIQGVAANASCLPFADDSFDAVICSEAIEHFEFPFEAMLEAVRVARNVVLFSTCEARANILAASLRLLLLNSHTERCGGHRSVWAPRDFRIMLGNDLETFTQHLKRPWTSYEPAELLERVCIPVPPPHLGEGIIAVKCLNKQCRRDEMPISDKALLEQLMANKVPLNRTVKKVPALGITDLVEWLVCPRCKCRLHTVAEGLHCAECKSMFSLDHGVPDLFVPENSDLRVTLSKIQAKVKGSTTGKKMRWSRFRSRQFDVTEKVLRRIRFIGKKGVPIEGVAEPSQLFSSMLNRLIRFVEFMDAQPSFVKKIIFIGKKPLRIIMRNDGIR